MKSKKIKVFLGGYINSTNAQNLNCRSLALHLNRNKFEIGVMTYPGEDLSVGKEFNHVKKFSLLAPLYRPLKFLRYIVYFRGLLWCDVAYLPKGEVYKYNQCIARLFKKKTFTTVEGVMNTDNYNSMMRIFGSESNIRKLYNGFDRTYSITQYMSTFNEKVLGIKSDGILYLGVETNCFNPQKTKEKRELGNIIFVGSNLKHKRIHEFIELAKIFPQLSFHIAGGDPSFADELKPLALSNLTFHGRLNHEDLSKLLATMDVHVFTSRSEGFPKVTLETAAAGVPSIVYGDYGAAEWITSGKDGFVVDKFEEIVDILNDLKANPEKLQSLSANALEMASRFDWTALVGTWEKAIMQTANSK